MTISEIIQGNVTHIAAGGHLVVFCDDDPLDGPMHATFKLSAGGESILLYDSVADAVCGSYTFGPQTTDISEGRQVDGSLIWNFFTTPTPGNPNYVISSVEPLPASAWDRILQVSPNPFNPSTEIVFELSRSADVRLQVYDLRGQMVRELVHGVQPAGEVRVEWNGLDHDRHEVASGTYMFRLSGEGEMQTRKAVLLK